MKFVCQICGYIYDEAKENLAFDQLPDSWVCPLCKAAKSAFAAEGKEENDRKEGEKEPVQQEEILTDPEYQELSLENCLFSAPIWQRDAKNSTSLRKRNSF